MDPAVKFLKSGAREMKSNSRRIILTVFTSLLMTAIFSRYGYVLINDAFAQQSVPPGQPTLTFDEFLKYKAFLKEEATEYRTFLEKLIAGGLVVLTALFTFLNYKTKSDVKKEVTTQLKEVVAQQINERVAAIERAMMDSAENKIAELKITIEKSFEQVESHIRVRQEEVDKWLVELSRPSQGADHASSPQDDSYQERIYGRRILWVDDNPANNSYQVELLTSFGARVEQVRTTEEALSSIKSGRKYDLLISDMNRHKNPKAGLEMLAKLQEEKSSVPVIFFSTRSSLQQFGDEALSSGAYACVNGNRGLVRAITSALFGKPPVGVDLS